MGKKNAERRESAWLTVRELANALDASEDFVRREVLRRVPADMMRRNTRPMRIYGRGAIEAWLKGTVATAGAVQMSADERQAMLDDLLLTDGMPAELSLTASSPATTDSNSLEEGL